MSRVYALQPKELDQYNAWIVDARTGSSEALDQLIEVLSEHLWREISVRQNRRGMGPSHGLSDLIQDTLLRVRERFCRFERCTFTEFKQWARAILFRRWQELARNHQARTSDEQRLRVWMALVARGAIKSEHTDPSEVQDDQEKAHRLLTSLRPHERNIIQLRLVNGLKFREIAAATGWSEDAARMAFTRAIDHLRELFEGNGNDAR